MWVRFPRGTPYATAAQSGRAWEQKQKPRKQQAFAGFLLFALDKLKSKSYHIDVKQEDESCSTYNHY